MKEPVRIAVVGAGLIGARHVEMIGRTRAVSLASIVDPSDAAAVLAEAEAVPHHPSLTEAIAAGGFDGVLLATPNTLHVDGALEAIRAGLPVLVEKPLASDAAGALEIVNASEAAGVPVLVGHHRRHNPIIQSARWLVDEGALGRLTTVQATTWFRKPDYYFDVAWRREAGGGPIQINLIHDIDLLQHFAGTIEEVHTFQSSAVRGFDVEDAAVVTLRFASGALGTINVSDATAAPWSWELTAGENSAYPATNESAYLIGGTEASLALPNLSIWRHADENSWWAPISATRVPIDTDEPLVRQIEHFADIIRGDAAPLVSARDGLVAVAAVEAVKRSGDTGQTVRIADIC
ncbi:Gfo/Idh/MocA family oxidoreductase [Alphaproteobacteria bacterium GH1-50]|uniref:Gfo/Idh/MocA family oxidoreductase n=1 Tax=Kangsaoukella pontilimi TaxID=2691042 RepID=A0A7C9NG71_9RHOB|nr:Gfo/Idh/MocA family oxidoreductase [Kangsaoukella pontilimi]MXQ09259.1 Gfo/Idh/MocA family oxidoreductase [Kangsaoukella pontilimi]